MNFNLTSFFIKGTRDKDTCERVMYASFSSELDFFFPSSRFSSSAAPRLVNQCVFRSTGIKSLILISLSGFFCLFYQYLGGKNEQD